MMESREYSGSSDNAETSFGMFSHDSTHVHLVREAERLSLDARKKAQDVLLRYVRDSYEKSWDGRDDTYNIEDAKNSSDVVLIEDLANFSFKIPENYNDARSNDDGERDVDPTDDSVGGENSEGGSQVFDHYRLETSTSEDIEQIGRCLEHFSPKAGRKRNSKNKLSGQYQFKTINSVVAVVKNVDDASIQSFQSLRQPSSTSTRKTSSLKKIFSLKKQSSSTTNNSSKIMGQSVNTDATVVKGETPMSTIIRTNRDFKNGHLPPKTPQVSSRLPKAPSASSSQATASNVDPDEFICAESSVSDISIDSIGEKAKRKHHSLTVTTDNIEIPVSICIKKKVRLKKIEVIKRKFSFSKGRF